MASSTLMVFLGLEPGDSARQLERAGAEKGGTHTAREEQWACHRAGPSDRGIRDVLPQVCKGRACACRTHVPCFQRAP